MNAYVHFRGRKRPVHNPAIKACILLVIVVLIVGLAPLWVPLHFVLRALGRRGFYWRPSPWDGGRLDLNAGAFRRPPK